MEYPTMTLKRNKPGPDPSRKPEEVAKALLEANGLVSFAAKKLRVNNSTVYKYIGEYPIVKQALEDARTGMGDAAEHVLYRNLKSGDQRAVEFYLKTIHKSRGYVERQELAGVVDRPITVNINRIPSAPAQDNGDEDAQ